MARNKFDVDERLESPFDIKHLKRAMKYIVRHKVQMILAFLTSIVASIASLFTPKITEFVLDTVVPNKDVSALLRMMIIFLLLIIFSMLNDLINYAIGLYKEYIYRIG